MKQIYNNTIEIEIAPQKLIIEPSSTEYGHLLSLHFGPANKQLRKTNTGPLKMQTCKIKFAPEIRKPLICERQLFLVSKKSVEILSESTAPREQSKFSTHAIFS